jgi:hypothetical protein
MACIAVGRPRDSRSLAAHCTWCPVFETRQGLPRRAEPTPYNWDIRACLGSLSWPISPLVAKLCEMTQPPQTTSRWSKFEHLPTAVSEMLLLSKTRSATSYPDISESMVNTAPHT